MNDEELRARVRESMFRQCHMRGYAAPVDVLMDIGALSKKNYEDWRFGRADPLERVCSMNLSKLSAVLREMYACAKAQNLKEYGLIQLIEDEAERQKALEDLNFRYNEERKAAAQEYAETLSSIVMPVWNQPEIQQASQQVDELFTKLREYSMASESEKPALLADLQALSAGMDEGALTEYLSLMTQIQSLLDSGMSESEVQALFPDIDFSTQLDQFAGIVSYSFAFTESKTCRRICVGGRR